MNLKSRKTVFITGLCLASLVSGVPLPANASADTTAMIPVSYTHLDVYKRQCIHFLSLNGCTFGAKFFLYQ